MEDITRGQCDSGSSRICEAWGRKRTKFGLQGWQSEKGDCRGWEGAKHMRVNQRVSRISGSLLCRQCVCKDTGEINNILNENTKVFWNRFLRMMMDTFNLHHDLLRLMTSAPIFLMKRKKLILKTHKLMMKI